MILISALLWSWLIIQGLVLINSIFINITHLFKSDSFDNFWTNKVIKNILANAILLGCQLIILI